MSDVGYITIEPGETPKCPGCGSNKWIVKQRIERESGLDRVDRFCDLVVESPDPNLYLQSLALECLDCNGIYQPQPGVAAKLGFEGNKDPRVEAYAQGSEEQLPDGGYKETPSGFEDNFGWPSQVGNDAEYQA